MKDSLIKHSVAPIKFAAGAVLVALFLSACSSTPLPPIGPLSDAKIAIDNAEQAEARQYAGAELEEAKTQFELAEKAVEAENMTEAERLALQSRVAAELAVARTEATKAAAINRDMERGAEALDEEMQRQGEQQ